MLAERVVGLGDSLGDRYLVGGRHGLGGRHAVLAHRSQNLRHDVLHQSFLIHGSSSLVKLDVNGLRATVAVGVLGLLDMEQGRDGLEARTRHLVVLHGHRRG